MDHTYEILQAGCLTPTIFCFKHLGNTFQSGDIQTSVPTPAG